jgi:pyochelin biosynthetic protein PchC
VTSELETASQRWLRRFHEVEGDRPRLVCLPHAGGSAASFYQLSAELSPAFDVVVVQYPGRQDRMADPMIDNVAELADHVAGALSAGGQPVALFGHSMGATVAFEAARRLQDLGTVRVTHLFASARVAPSRPEGRALVDDEDLLAEMLLHGLDPALLENAELLELVMPVMRNDFHAVSSYRYRPGPPLECPLTVLLGADDPIVGEADARAWTEHTSGGVEFETFPGGHLYLADQSTLVANVVRRRMNET